MLKDYQKFVLSKAAPEAEFSIPDFHLMHGCLGLSTEFLELSLSSTSENTQEELGDLCFYLIFVANWIEFPLDNLPLLVTKKELPAISLKQLAGALEDFISSAKKHLIYRNRQDQNLRICFYKLWIAFLAHCTMCEYPIDLCIVENQAKLAKRYKDSFSQEEAEQRKDKA